VAEILARFLQHLADRAGHEVDVERLGDVVVGAGIKASFDVFFALAGGHQDERDFA